MAIGRVLVALTCTLMVAYVRPALSQELNDRPVRVVVGFGPGGLGDIVARLVTSAMSESLHTPFVVDNLPGAGGLAAASSVARASPDGRTILLVSGQNAASPSLFKSMPYDPADLSPISLAGEFDYVFLVRKDSPLSTFQDMVAKARKEPGKLNIATISTGSLQNLAVLYFASQAGLQVQTVAFRTTGEVVAAVLSGQVDAALETVPGVIGQVRSGELRALALSSDRSAPLLKGTPTIAESGFPSFSLTSWNGFMLPTKTPAATTARLTQEIGKAIAKPDVRERLLNLAVTPLASSADDMQKIFQADVERWRRVVADAKIEPQ